MMSCMDSLALKETTYPRWSSLAEYTHVPSGFSVLHNGASSTKNRNSTSSCSSTKTWRLDGCLWRDSSSSNLFFYDICDFTGHFFRSQQLLTARDEILFFELKLHKPRSDSRSVFFPPGSETMRSRLGMNHPIYNVLMMSEPLPPCKIYLLLSFTRLEPRVKLLQMAVSSAGWQEEPLRSSLHFECPREL
jgi:hypothetical protein